ncbi:MAG: glutaredoxin [Acidobacteriota bacterium]|nr:glutaredoxin [Acidobacteriota bacterium]
MAKIVVYTTDSCRYCVAVKTLLQKRALQFSEVNLERDMDGRVALARRTGMMTFPQVLVDEKLLGGFEETRAAMDNGLLDELLAA